MADLVNYGSSERDIEQAITALKKGTQLIKYCRKGKPKLCPFRLSNDETTLIWYSHGEERTLKLCSVTKIIPGQRTAVFRRYLRPEKDYLSFSLIYNNGERSLDVICKDKAESEVWFSGLKALISNGQRKRGTSDGSSGNYVDNGELISNSPRSIPVTFGATLELNYLASPRHPSSRPFAHFGPYEPSLNLTRSDVGADRANMQLKGAGDGLRLSVSSYPSTSSQSSGPEDCESLGDVFVWGQVWIDGPVHDGSSNFLVSRTDILLPKPLESSVVLDVHQIASGVRHAALITKQGEVFTWGEESGGRLGHGVDVDASRPQLVESLANCTVEYVACGEYHTSAVTVSGDLYTWGDGTHNAGLLGHGTDVSHWVPKRVAGPLEGLQVSSVACGTWHTALATSNGQLFTFGDGTFGALGHGDRESTAHPKEVESLRGLKTVKVSCGVWHTAAIVEVIVAQPGANVSSRKLFTWGDGDKYRLGHGDKEARLVPTCVPSLIEHNFHEIACGHSMTVGLTTTGHVFTMGSPAYGQLGNPQSDGKVPCLVQDRLMGESVEEITCGSYHVAILTSRSEVYTWGRGANGRLGHGDVEDRKTPFLVEALKDRLVRNISCGSNFTAVVCVHKWVSGSDQSVCSGCKQTFGFTRKRHNCYNCGLVHCHACSSKKTLRAALAPTPGKPHRVCDSCYAKLKAAEAIEASASTRKNATPRRTGDHRDRIDRVESKLSKVLMPPSMVSPGSSSRPVSPYSRRPSPPRSATPMPTVSGLAYSKSMFDSLKKTNELLTQEVQKLQTQMKSLRVQIEMQDVEFQKSERRAQEAASVAAEEKAKLSAAKEVIKSLTAQLKDVAGKAPTEYSADPPLMAVRRQSPIDLSEGHHDSPPEIDSQANDLHKEELHESSFTFDSPEHNHDAHDNCLPNSEIQNDEQERKSVESNDSATLQESDEGNQEGGEHNNVKAGNNMPQTAADNDLTSPKAALASNELVAEWTVQFEPGAYVTLLRLKSGLRYVKKVRFSRRKFDEKQAEVWWAENHLRVFERYRCRGMIGKPPNAAAGVTSSSAQEDDIAASSH